MADTIEDKLASAQTAVEAVITNLDELLTAFEDVAHEELTTEDVWSMVCELKQTIFKMNQYAVDLPDTGDALFPKGTYY